MVGPTLRALLAPRVLLLHALGVAATTAALLLGLWQLDAWQAGRAAEVRDLPGGDVGRPVTLAGTWIPDSTLLVADRDLGGRTGLWVVTPVAVCDGPTTSCDPDTDPAMLVVRGWTPTETAVPPPPSGEAELTGETQGLLAYANETVAAYEQG